MSDLYVSVIYFYYHSDVQFFKKMSTCSLLPYEGGEGGGVGEGEGLDLNIYYVVV